MKNEEIEKEQFEAVFGVCFKEGPWAAETASGTPFKRRYWYEGVPGYVAQETPFKRCAVPLRTVIEESCGNSGIALHKDVKGWEYLAHWTSSGETECGCKDYEGATEPDPTCPLCEGSGYIYIGDAAEVVYRQVPYNAGTLPNGPDVPDDAWYLPTDAERAELRAYRDAAKRATEPDSETYAPFESYLDANDAYLCVLDLLADACPVTGALPLWRQYAPRLPLPGALARWSAK